MPPRSRNARTGRLAARVVFLAALVTALAGATGCSARRPATPASRPPAPAANPAPALPKPTPAEALVESSREEFRQGIQALRDGQREAARLYFDRSVTLLLDAPEGLWATPEIGEALTEIIESVHAIELESFQHAGTEELEHSAFNDLLEIEPELSPEEAAEELEIVEKAEATYDLPVVLNDKVLSWIDAYSGRLKDRYQPGLTRSGQYIDRMREILREEGLPEDLVYMAHVESAWKTRAYSRAHAKGIWQFISATGRRYGLKRDWWVDERSDPEKSCRAAAAYLKDLYAMFGDWYLAMAAYNAGEGKVRRGLARTGYDNFWDLAKTRYLRRETRNYVPAILATIVISKDPEKFGFSAEKDPPLEWDTVTVDKPIDLRVVAKYSGTTLEEIRRLNPALLRLQTPPNYGNYRLHLPAGSGPAFQIAVADLPDKERLLATYHKVRRGETLGTIGRKYGVSISALASANGIRNRNRIRVGQVLTVPTSLAGAQTLSRTRSTATASSGVAARGSGKITYRVRRGDTLYSIARRYRTTVSALRAANGMSRRSVLKAGSRLVIYPGSRSVPGDRIKVTHRVRRGDTLSRIARAYGSSINDLCRWNGISKHSILRIGQTLTIYR